MKQEVIDALIAIAGPKQVFFEASDIEGYLYDSTEEFVRPEACRDIVVVRPGTYEEVSEVMKYANESLTPVIVRGGGTGATGAAVPTFPCIIMSMERFREILEVDELSMMITCQAGVSLAQLNDYLAENVHSLYFPCHPGDEGAHVGGMAIENAGGVRAVKHGIMRNYIKGMKVCLPSGEIVTQDIIGKYPEIIGHCQCSMRKQRGHTKPSIRRQHRQLDIHLCRALRIVLHPGK